MGAAILATHSATVGLSNVFTTAATRVSVRRDLPAAIGDVFPGVPIVGYEQRSALAAATDSGFEPIAPLRVWLKPGA